MIARDGLIVGQHPVMVGVLVVPATSVLRVVDLADLRLGLRVGHLQRRSPLQVTVPLLPATGLFCFECSF